MLDEFLTATEAAAYLKLSPKTLAGWRVRGEGPKHRLHGRRVVYSTADLRCWSDSRRRTSTSESVGFATTVTPSAIADLQDRCQEVMALLPEEYLVDFNALLSRLEEDGDPKATKRSSYIRSILRMLKDDGAGESVGQAIRDFNANGELNLARFKGYWRRSQYEQKQSVSNRGGLRQDGERMLAAKRLMDLLIQHRHTEFRRSLEVGFFDSLSESQQRAINAVGGVEAILADMTSTDRRMLIMQLAKVVPIDK